MKNKWFLKKQEQMETSGLTKTLIPFNTWFHHDGKEDLWNKQTNFQNVIEILI